MSNELKATGTPANGTMSAFLILSSNGYLWDTNATAFAATPTAANAAIELTEAGSTGRMVGDIPAAALTAAAGYSIKAEYIDVVPESVAFTDTVAEREVIQIDGAGEVASGLVTQISTKQVSDDRTHFTGTDGYRASNIIEVKQNFVGTLSIVPALNPSTDISAVSSVTITGAATVTASSLTTTADRKRANYTVPAMATVGTYTVLATVTTTDSQTIPMEGTLMVI